MAFNEQTSTSRNTFERISVEFSIRNYWLLVIFICTVHNVRGFNVDTKYPVVFKNSVWNSENTYFGFSVAFHRNDAGKIILVTAPKANGSAFGSDVVEPGILYKCIFVEGESTTTCNEVEIDTTGNENEVKESDFVRYKDLKNKMWFGVSMDVQHNGQNNVVVCGHLWKNQKFSDYWANGVCYLLTKDLTLLNGNKYLPLVDRSKNTKYVNSTQVNYYQYGQFGISTSFTQDEKRLVFGAPGFFEWTGTGLGYEVEESGKLSKPIIPNPTYVYRKYPYIGYSVTTGKFFKLSETESVVLGAPRDSDASGKVYIISGYAFFTSKSFKEEAKFEGSQMGEYFGATVLALDLNNDKYSDLLVGAPLFSLESGSDEGRVYLYLSDGVGLQLSSVKLIGSKTYNSRFGSTLAKVGDLDQDGYLDVAIGAPYEDDRGAVYIYNGSPETGLKPKFSQRIFAADVDQNYNLRGFGISIAKSIDVDDNLYQDLLIGAHESGHAVLLRTNPVAHIECNLSFNKDVIDRNHLDCSYNDEQYSCVELNYCIQYNGRNLPKSQTLQVKITSDVTQSGKPSRGFFIQDQQRKQDFILALNLLYDSPYCGRENFYIKNNLNDLSPLTFTLSYALLSEPSSVFCKNCPIVNKDQPSAMMKKIKFYISCGKEECISDLKVSANILNYKEGETLVIGQNTSLTLEIQVTNQINPAHDAKAFIKIPPDVAVMNQDRCYIITGNSDNTLQCDIGNPLNINDIVKFQVKLDTSKLTGKSKEIKIDINVISQSKEQHLLDNSVSVIVSFIAKTHISITGFTEREQILYGPGQPGVLPLEQGYMVSKISPSPISVVTLIISVPSSVGRNTQQLVNVHQVEVGDGSNTYVSGSCNIRTVDELDETGTDVDDTDWEHILSCKTAVCREIRCDVGPFSNIRKVAKVRIVGEVDTEALKKTLGRKDVITIKSEAKVWIPDPAGYDPNVPPDYTSSAKTQLVLAGAPPPIQVAAWIYIVSIIVGIFLLLLLGYGMYRLGFFKRKQREDLEKMKEQRDTDELKPCLESKTNYDKDSFS